MHLDSTGSPASYRGAHLTDKCGELARPEVILAVLDQGLVAPAEAQQVHREYPVRLGQLIDVVSPVVGACAKAMN